ncbi:MAG TPA: hypothetical protein VL242_53320 [Sorangium sp.]|nr:hypothetical protein [Sorangium sp.]
MSDPTNNTSSAVPYVLRVFTNESVKKGAAAAVAGLLVAAVSEAIWPSR